MKKGIRNLLLSCFALATVVGTLTFGISAATTYVYHHGNDYSTNTCYASTTASAPASIGAKITWQLSGSNTVSNGPYVSNSGAYSITSSSYSLDGLSGKSYGYFYIGGVQTGQSTAWMDFTF